MGVARKEEELERREGKCILVGSRFANNPYFYYLCVFLSVLLNNNKSKIAKLFVIISAWICLNV